MYAMLSDRPCLNTRLTIGLGKRRDGLAEPAVVTAGARLNGIARLLRGRENYAAADVVSCLTVNQPLCLR